MLRLTHLDAQAEGIGVDPRNPPLVWEVWNGEAWIRARVDEDTTGGLNRAGDIVLLVPMEHELLTLGNTAAYWLRARLLRPRAGQPTYQASPRIRSVEAAALGGTVAAEHAETVPVGDHRPQRRPPGAGVRGLARARSCPGDEGEHVHRDRRPTAPLTGHEVDDFTASGPRDRHYVWDSGSGAIRFGPQVRYPDGSVRQHGRIPRDGAADHGHRLPARRRRARQRRRAHARRCCAPTSLTYAAVANLARCHRRRRRRDGRRGAACAARSRCAPDSAR